MEPKPTLTKKGVAHVLGCTPATVRQLVDNDVLVGYVPNEAGTRWIRHTGERGPADLYFDLADVLLVRETRPKRQVTASREADIRTIPKSPVIPTMTSKAAAARLGIEYMPFSQRIQNQAIRAYVINDAGTAWVLYGSPESARNVSVFLLPEDVDAYAETFDREQYERRSSGKTGRIPKRQGKQITVPIRYPEKLVNAIKARHAEENLTDWFIAAAEEKLKRES